MKHNRAISPLCFGTAQLGMAYGIANKTGQPSPEDTHAMLAAAIDSGITLFDTARGYGQSEARLGAFLRTHPGSCTVMTKLGALDHTSVEESIRTSLENLGLSCLPYLQLHKAEHLHDSTVWNPLLAMKKAGLIERLGVSVYTPQEALSAIATAHVELIQLPYNILDARWEQAGVVQALTKRSDILVLARSVFLQGLLTQVASAWNMIPTSQAKELTQLLDGWVKKYHRKNRADLCLAFARAQRWIDSIIVGMETLAQLRDNVAMFASAPLSEDECAAIRAELPALSETFLNPVFWPKS